MERCINSFLGDSVEYPHPSTGQTNLSTREQSLLSWQYFSRPVLSLIAVNTPPVWPRAVRTHRNEYDSSSLLRRRLLTRPRVGDHLFHPP